MVDPSFAAPGHGVGPGSTDETGPRAEGERFHHVEAATNAAIHEDLAAIADGISDRRQRTNRRGHVIELTTPVVGDDHAVSPIVERSSRVVGIEDALQRDLAAPVLAQPGEVIPGDAGIELAGHPPLEVTGHACVRQRLLEVAERERFATDGDVAEPTGVAHEVETTSQALRRGEFSTDAVSNVAVALADDGQVDGQYQRRATHRLSPNHQVLGVTAVLHDVQLEPWRCRHGAGHLFDAADRERRLAEGDSGALGSSGRLHFCALREHPSESDGGEDDR